MKKIIGFIILFISLNSFAQTKILFDATKAEMASNADWVIDADLHNIMGNESNPQQIPTPAQSGITATTTQSYWKGALSAWAVDAVKLGYEVETLPNNGAITYGNAANAQDLSNYTIFVVCEPNILFTATEKAAIVNYVAAGGSLFMISDHNNSDRNGDGSDSPYIWNDLMNNNTVQNNPFGIAFDYNYFTETTLNIPNLPSDALLHGSYGDVSSVEFYGGTSMTLNTSQNTTVKGVVYRSSYNNLGNTGVLCAYANYGQGKVVALGDSSPADDGSGDSNDNLYDGWITDASGNHERLIMNATIWLATPSALSVDSLVDADEHIQIYSQSGQQITLKTAALEESSEVIFYDLLGQEIKKISINAFETKTVVLANSKKILLYRIKNTKGFLKTGKLMMY